MLITQIQGNAGPGVSGLPCSWEGGELEGSCALLITVIAPSLLGVEQVTVLALSGAYRTIHPSIHLPRRGRLRCGSRRRDAVPADGTGTLGITLASPRLHSHLPAGTRGSSVTARNTARQKSPWDMGRDSPWPGTGRSQVRECRARCPQRSGASSGTGQPSHAPRAGFKCRNNPEWACRAPANCPSSDLKEHRRVSEENEQEL